MQSLATILLVIVLAAAQAAPQGGPPPIEQGKIDAAIKKGDRKSVV